MCFFSSTITSTHSVDFRCFSQLECVISNVWSWAFASLFFLEKWGIPHSDQTDHIKDQKCEVNIWLKKYKLFEKCGKCHLVHIDMSQKKHALSCLGHLLFTNSCNYEHWREAQFVTRSWMAAEAAEHFGTEHLVLQSLLREIIVLSMSVWLSVYMSK